MKRNSKSAPLTRLALVFCLGALGACDSIAWPHVYGPNEVPQEVRDTPRKVPTAPDLDADEVYPRLGDVPSHPKNFTPQPSIDQSKQQLDEDRVKNQRMKQEYQNTLQPPPPPAQ